MPSLELAKRGWDTVGIDSVGRAIDKAKTRPASGSVRFVIADATNLDDTCGRSADYDA